MSLKEKLFKQLEDNEDRMIQIRRHLHENPELSFKEEKTAQFIEEFYRDKEVSITTNVGNGNGIIVEIEGGAGEGPTLGLRADFDALPIVEEANVEFKSKNEGVMHACGHDGHTAYLLILGEALIDLKDEWKGKIKLIHQHAEEEPPGGAKSIVASGILDDLDEVYGIHLFPTIDVGDITVCAEEAMTGRSNFELKIQGSGGHGAMPHTTNDALVAGGYFVTTAQTIVSRRMNPNDSVVVSITAFDAPGGYNVIQDSVTLRGTVRYLSMDNQEPIYEEMERLVKGLEVTYGVECTLDYVYDYPVLYNTPEIIDEIEETLSESAGSYFEKVYRDKPQAASEDFAYYLQEKPGAFIFVGAKPEGVENAYPNHHPKFEVNEKSLIISAKAMADIILKKIQ
jgi:amidohydrolase